MSSKDYLTRYFEQLGKVIATLMGLRENKKYQLALEEINQVLDSWFDLTESKLTEWSEEELCEMLLDTHSNNFEKERSVAELLYQKVLTYIEMKQLKEAHTLAAKSLALFKAIDRESGAYSIDVQQRIAELDTIVSGAYLA